LRRQKVIIDKAKGNECPIPHEASQYMRIRPLTWGEVKEARDVMLLTNSQSAQELMSKLTPEAIAGLKNEQRSRTEDPITTFDRGTVLGYAILDWSYEPSIEDGLPNLDEKTAAWAFKTAVDMFTGDPDEGEA
jgi:hypothetical protein